MSQRARTPGVGWVRRRARSRFRQATRRWRALPDFLVIGGVKCGTSSLYAVMADHPNIVWARKKELHFFDGPRAAGGMDAYRTNFPPRLQLRARRAITGEATASYLFEPSVLPAVHGALPDVRLIVSIRDPVERAVSHYFHDARHRAGGVRTDPAGDAYVSRGRYAERLRAWLEVFPPEQVLVLVYEDVVREPAANLHALWRFLGIAEVSSGLPHRNVGDKQVIDDDVIVALREQFRQPNHELAELLETVPVVRPPGPRAPAWAVDP